MNPNDNHTPIPKDLSSQQTLNPPQKPSQSPTQPSSVVPSSKEQEPIKTKTEQKVGPEDTKDNEQQSENPKEKIDGVRAKVLPKTPPISKEASDAGLAIAPSAKPFPTIYDVKVPIYNDVQIEENLHKSFWTGARWLAELCKYMLWQSHIKLKKIGSKIIRQQT